MELTSQTHNVNGPYLDNQNMELKKLTSTGLQLKKLTNNEIVNKMHTLAKKERELLLVIKEIDRRRLYLELNYPSLFSYLTKCFGYSEGSAQRRIDAARLLNEVPSLGVKIESGEITLNHIALIQRASREVKKETHLRVQTQSKAELIESVCKTSSLEAEKIIAEVLNIKPKAMTQIRPQANATVRIEVTLTEAQFQKLQRAKALLSNSVPDGDLATLLEYLSDKVIAQKEKPVKKVTATVAVESKSRNVEPSLEPQGNKVTATLTVESQLMSFKSGLETRGAKSTATVAVESQSMIKAKKPIAESQLVSVKQCLASQSTGVTATMAVTPVLKRKILQRDQCCQYSEPKTGKKCESLWQLEVDHRQARWSRGTNEDSNLRLLCKAHNLFLYRKSAGIRHQ